MTLAFASLVAVPQPAYAGSSGATGWSGSVHLYVWAQTCDWAWSACSYKGGFNEMSGKKITQTFTVQVRNVPATSAWKFWKWGNGSSKAMVTNTITKRNAWTGYTSGVVRPGVNSVLVFAHTSLTRYGLSLDSGNAW